METAGTRSATLIRFGKTVLCIEQIAAIEDGSPRSSIASPFEDDARTPDEAKAGKPVRVTMDSGAQVAVFGEDADQVRKLRDRLVTVDEVSPILDVIYKNIGVRGRKHEDDSLHVGVGVGVPGPGRGC